MDTLCIPVGIEELPLRLGQIDNMASIYKGASCSLLLDAELMNTRCTPSHAYSSRSPYNYYRNLQMNFYRGSDPPLLNYAGVSVEMHARLACSIWMTRSWTLQEGRLPSHMAVKFQNKMVILGRTSERDGEYAERLVDTDVETSESPRRASQVENLSNQASNQSTVHNEPVSDDIQLSQTAKQPECECVEIALQRTFYDTFFDEPDWRRKEATSLVRKFASCWDELAGRSTTMANDIPLIMTNMLNLINRGLLDLDDAGHMFQSILLSLDRVPISIFFNTGPRQGQDDHHLNRWIPTKIGSFGLVTSQEFLTIQPSYLEYTYSSQAEGRNVRAYTTESILPLKAKTYISLGSQDSVYTVRPSVSTSDRFSTVDFTRTCLIIEQSNPCSHEDFLRGACFYVQDSPEKRSKNTELLNWDMTFYCPVRVRKIPADRDPLLSLRSIYALDYMKDSRKLRVRYGMFSPGQ